MTAGIWQITVEQGATWMRTLLIEDAAVARDLTGYTARMQVRAWKPSTTLLELTTENGRIAIPAPLTGEIVLQLTAVETAALSQSGLYDLELVSGDDVTRLLEGSFTVAREVTR